jgi:catechol 2,3-dioxygenase-like lactoylglutathione lyase family enzyme
VRPGSSGTGGQVIESAHGERLPADQALEERSSAQEERASEARRSVEDSGEAVVSVVTAVHLYVTDLDRSVDFYSRLLGYGPAAAYDEGENAHSAFFVLEQQTFLVLTWDPDRGREVGGAVRLELAAEDLEAEVGRLEAQGIDSGAITRTRFGTEVYDLADPDGHLVRVGPAWTLHAIEGAV